MQLQELEELLDDEYTLDLSLVQSKYVTAYINK